MSEAGTGRPDPARAEASGGSRTLRVFCRAEWVRTGSDGLLASDSRARTLRKVLVTYPEVRHILPDRISLDATTDTRVLETIARFLERQQWLVSSIAIE